MALDGRDVLVLGGGSGIGRATAKQAAMIGARVVVAGRTERALRAVADEVGGSFSTVDLSRETEVAALFAKRRFDHVVITAANAAGAPFLTRSVADARADMDAKFWNQCIAVKYAAPAMNAGGSITLFSGLYARRPTAGTALVAAANAAIEGLARALAVELAPLRINVISPGMTNTPLYGGMPEAQRDGMFHAVASVLPARRIGQPEDVAAAAIYAMSNPFVTGTVIDVEGGALLV